MSYFCSPKSEWEITIEKFCDLSKPWGMWWGIQLKNLNAVVPSPVSCHPLPQALKASIIRAPQRAVRQQSPERERLSQTHNSYTAPGKQESCLSGHETQLLQGTGRSPLHLRSLLPAACSLCLLRATSQQGKRWRDRAERSSIFPGQESSLLSVIPCGFSVPWDVTGHAVTHAGTQSPDPGHL